LVFNIASDGSGMTSWVRFPAAGLEKHEKMEEKIVAKFNRASDHLYIYQDGVMIASYWRVAGLAIDGDGKYRVIGISGSGIGRITGEANIRETW